LLEFIENIAALQLDQKDIDENKTNTVVEKETQEKHKLKKRYLSF